MSDTYDDQAIDIFARGMKDKMEQCRDRGKYGWDNPNLCSEEHLLDLLIASVKKGDLIDIANYSMMLYNRCVDGEFIKNYIKNYY